MAIRDWRQLTRGIGSRVAQWPLWAWAAIAVAVLAVILFAALESGGPRYVALYDGLSPRQGGQVIAGLQKLGVPYQLNATGSVVSVPVSDLARARLELGESGVPTTGGSAAWKALTKGSLTLNSTAVDALSKRVLETRLEHVIDGVDGISEARVTLAVPRSTPFLGDQPHAKASVWLQTTAVGISSNEARAIAQLVASSVPGLAVDRVTVTDQNGRVLAPRPEGASADANWQLVLQRRIEASDTARVAALIEPLVGDGNFRVAVAAGVDFGRQRSQGVRYGPREEVDHVSADKETRIGSRDRALGVPGALSNQPPGRAAAPARAAQKAPAATIPRSSKNNTQVKYDVDRTAITTEGPTWGVRALSVSVVLNQAVVRHDPALAGKVKAIVTNAVTAPKVSVAVAVLPFSTASAPVRHGSLATLLASNRSIVRALLELLAAALLLFGVARPLARWLGRARPPRRVAPLGPTADMTPPPVEDPVTSAQQDRVARSSYVAAQHPEDVIETLHHWMDSDRDADGGNNPPPSGGAV